MIIPQINWAEDVDCPDMEILYPTICPVCGGETSVEKSVSGVENLVCVNPDCDGKLINKLDHFAGKKGLDIKGLSKATLEKIIDWGWVESCKDLFYLFENTDESVQKPGFGIKSVNNISFIINSLSHICN